MPDSYDKGLDAVKQGYMPNAGDHTGPDYDRLLIEFDRRKRNQESWNSDPIEFPDVDSELTGTPEEQAIAGIIILFIGGSITVFLLAVRIFSPGTITHWVNHLLGTNFY